MPLKDLLKARFTTAIQSIPPPAWKILITDDHSQALLDTVYKNFDILQQNVTSVEPLHSPRAPMSVDAIYLLTPTSQNVDRILADFQGRRTYKSAHLYFIDGIDDVQAQRLTDGLQGGILQAFTELYCNVWAIEDRVFSLKSPWSFFTMFGPLGGAASADLAIEAFEDDIKVTGRSILNFLATVNENPHIRYYQPHHHAPLGPLAQQAAQAAPVQQPQTQSLRWRSAMGGGSRTPEIVGDHLSKKIAFQVQSDLDEYLQNNPEFPPASGRPKGVLFVVDRSMDPAAPLLHEFWYQAMVNDLLKVEDGVHYRYKYTNTIGGTEEKTADLTEADPVWVSVRHLHMKDAIDTLMMDFGKFAQEHAGFSGGSNVNVNDLKDMLASLPQFQTQREQFSLHLDMAQECMTLFEKKKLSLVANVEQCCATGYTSEGKTPKTLVEEMVPLLDDRTNITSLDKVRIMALYILFRDGVADEDRRRLYQHARLSISEQDMVNNLIHLGVKVIKDSSRSSKTRIKQKPSNQEGEYELSRYKPVIQMVMEDHNASRLDQSTFPYVKDAPVDATTSLRAGSSLAAPSASGSGSLRSARPTWHKAPSARMNNTEGKQRMIIFVAGGMTYSEMRCAYTVGQALGKDVYIGSTHVITPEIFTQQLRALGRGGIGANPPGGLQPHPQGPGRPTRQPGKPTSYQHILDFRHWTVPVGPPPLAPPPQPQQPAQQNLLKPQLQHQSSFASSLNGSMSNLSLGNGKDGKDGEKKKKKKLFGMKL
ncbi:syntaxin-binding protein 1 [Kwoniella heveanensis BCC8398]|uniref:Syntaxin-binding protein 1 n=1 Tax=Kwoniella heveanensis BCC8398 TaxID=1296120 RepID=A0A1B9GTJ6_9TREE|nr:syntaxin-binding protein 1 [Kwoniella heveanensis BCC8398]